MKIMGGVQGLNGKNFDMAFNPTSKFLPKANPTGQNIKLQSFTGSVSGICSIESV